MCTFVSFDTYYLQLKWINVQFQNCRSHKLHLTTWRRHERQRVCISAVYITATRLSFAQFFIVRMMCSTSLFAVLCNMWITSRSRSLLTTTTRHSLFYIVIKKQNRYIHLSGKLPNLCIFHSSSSKTVSLLCDLLLCQKNFIIDTFSVTTNV